MSIAITGPNYRPGYSGISNFTFADLYAFNITTRGSQWLGIPTRTATFNVSSPVTAFGLWLSGVQTTFTRRFTLTFNDGRTETLNPPVNVNGGATYYGFTNTSTFSSITITNLSNNAWGIDDVSCSAISSTTSEPSILMLVGSGTVGLARLVCCGGN